MFRQRRPPFADFINWTDYHWDPAPRPQGPIQGPWGNPRRYGFGHILLAGLAVLIGVKLLSAYRSYRGFRLGRVVLGVIVLAIFAALSSRRRSSLNKFG
jgi:hypothetical protein